MPLMAPKTFEEADQSLLELGRAKNRVAAAELIMNEDISAAKLRASEATEGDREFIRCVREGLEECWLKNKAQVKGKSWKGTFGTIGQRKSTGVRFLRGWNGKKVLAAITAAGKKLEAFLRIKPALNKRAILDASPLLHEALRQCGVDTDRRETFFAEPDEAAIATAPGPGRELT
jgi:hypothetical protein